MEIRSELYSFLGISGIFIGLPGGETVLSSSDYIDRRKIKIKAATEITNSVVCVKISLKSGGEIKIVSNAQKDYSAVGGYCCYFTNPLPHAFEDKVMEFENLAQISDKRSEVRYPVGIKSWKEFGLARPECAFAFAGQVSRGVIADASFHGCLFVGERISVGNGSIVSFSADANDGKIIQKANLVSAENAAKNFFRYRLHFLEPLSIKWVRLVRDFAGNNK